MKATTTSSKKPIAARPEFTDVRKACRTPAEREQLETVLQDGWTAAELAEFARLYFFKNGRDYPTPASYRRALTDIAGSIRCASFGGTGEPHSWLKRFRKGGSKPRPPRREGLLIRGRGNGPKVTPEEYAYPEHTEAYRTLIEQRCRQYFKISPDRPVHPNAWAASARAYAREWCAKAEAERKAREAVMLVLSPKSLKKSKTKAPRRRIVSSFDCGYVYDTLKPHFNVEFPGHTDAFREEVAALARKDKGKKPDADISPRAWKIACHKNYVLIEA